MPPSGTAIIVGAGIGGLAAAISLRRQGWEVRVYDRAPDPGDLGFALGLASNAMSALEELGAAAPIRAAGWAARRGELCHPDGRVLKRLEAQSGDPLVIALRRDIHNTLLQESGTQVLRAEATRVEARDGRVDLEFSDGASDCGDLVVGADGVGSIVRRQLHPDEPPPPASGYSAVRGVTFTASEMLGDLDGVGYFGDGVEVAAIRAGRDAIYWFVSHLTRDLGNRPRDPQSIAEDFTRGFEPRFRRILAATPLEQMRFDELFLRPPLSSWGRGRVTLLGDAAHPVLPHTAQGAAQSLEDAVALGLALAKDASIESALRRYERVRGERTRRIIALGPRIARVTTTRNRWVQAARTIALRSIPAAVIAAGNRATDPHKALR